MRNRSLFLVLVLLILAIDALQAQITVVSIDPDFGNGGTVEVNLSGFDDHITSAYTFKNEPIHVCGKIGTANAGIYHLGMTVPEKIRSLA